MADAESIVKRRKRLGKRAHRLESDGRYEEAAVVHAELDGLAAELGEARRAERVGRRRARIERNYGFVHGGFRPTNLEDVIPLMRAAVLIDVSYHPDSYPS